MPHHKSCKKRLKQAEKERVRNNTLKTRLRKTVRTTRTQVEQGQAIDLNATYAEIDQACGRGLIHKNKAARLKSRLTKAIAKNPKKES